MLCNLRNQLEVFDAWFCYTPLEVVNVSVCLGVPLGRVVYERSVFCVFPFLALLALHQGFTVIDWTPVYERVHILSVLLSRTLFKFILHFCSVASPQLVGNVLLHDYVFN